ncbi:MAG: helix-turn-helix domain-containing protein [Sphingobacteriales bacterium JAD_PAG50586_3]|nr:MAG: helix-turn-helix domain-containing protein [Sphingobacteriales bacterium JAD_PAG50586_3]
MAVHIGKIIQALVKSKGISVTDFADMVNYSRRNVYEIFEKATIDTGLLIKISKVLKKNLFFEYITEDEAIEYANTLSNENELLAAIKDVKKTVTELKEGIDKITAETSKVTKPKKIAPVKKVKKA